MILVASEQEKFTLGRVVRGLLRFEYLDDPTGAPEKERLFLELLGLAGYGAPQEQVTPDA